MSKTLNLPPIRLTALVFFSALKSTTLLLHESFEAQSHIILNSANLQKALEAHKSVIDAHDTASKSLSDLKKLLEEIETLLRKAVGTPGDIRRIAKDCLELKVQLTPQQIEDLSRKIVETIQSLSNIGNILSETQDDKERTIDLRNKANRIK